MPTSIVERQFTPAHGKLLLVMSLDPHEIGRRIKSARDAAGLTQLDLALKANVSPSTITRWEAGKLPPVRELVRLSGVLGVEPGYLVEGSDDESPSDDRITGLEEQVAALRQDQKLVLDLLREIRGDDGEPGQRRSEKR